MRRLRARCQRAQTLVYSPGVVRVSGLAVVALLLTALAGGGGSPAKGPTLTFSFTPLKPRFVARTAPIDGGSPPGGTGVALARSGLGFVAAGREIARTHDYGGTWHPVWTRSGTRVEWIGFAGRLVVASAHMGNALLLLRSGDRGGSWSTVRPRLPVADSRWELQNLWSSLDFSWASARIGFAHVDPDNYDFLGRLLRTGDGGRTWRFVGPRWLHAFSRIDTSILALAYGRSCQRLWRSDDLGLSWRLVRWHLPCRASLTALSFVSPEHGYAAGGVPYYASNDARQFVLETRDGGISWRRIWRSEPGFRSVGRPFNRLEVDASGFGVALNGGCKNGQNSPCTGQVFVTSDGGRSWTDDGIDAYRVDFAGRRALAVRQHAGDVFAALYQRVGGRRWKLRVRLGALVRTATASGRFDDLQVSTEVGRFRSTDGGRNWRVLQSYPAPYDVGERTIVRHGVWARASERYCLLSRDGGHTWKAIVPIDDCYVPVFDLDAAGNGVLTRNGLSCVEGSAPLLTSEDAGRTWSRSGLRMGTWDAAVDGRLVALVGDRRSRTGACVPAVALSRDGLRTWTLVDLPLRSRSGWCSHVSIAGTTIWVSSCFSSRIVGFVSPDAGRHFTPVPGRRLSVVALDREHAFATSNAPGGVWRTSDAGKTWHQVWPRLPISALRP